MNFVSNKVVFGTVAFLGTLTHFYGFPTFLICSPCKYAHFMVVSIMGGIFWLETFVLYCKFANVFE